ncbi:outer membrane beta-barrel protein [Mesonia aestuariivivens]|uniref:PorT family protein n=1 Tax=Mesonia aestuariivivens TaxID=2796128 RepID=A0ABS6W330_9FLAO|nr:outer membrane beta-barrel protein [Mesonia aestuariivivens]MBW2962119.1 PorT family protein [Mesonia aestuariivivens]
MNLKNQYSKLTKAKYNVALVSLTLLFMSQLGFAQSQHEISIVGSGVFSTVSYDTQNAYIDQAQNGSIGLGYSFYFSRQWAVNIGAEYEQFKASLVYNTLQLSSEAVDIEGENFEYRYSADNYEEEQKLNVINIPLTVQFQTDGETKFYARLGGQVSLINKAEYATSIRTLTTSGYYAQYDAELFDPSFMGFGRYTNLSQKSQELELDTSFAAVIEAGVKREIDNIGGLYIGLFCNYGLNTIDKDTENTPLIEYNTENPTSLKTNSVLNTNLAEDVRLISYGIKLRFALGGY